MGHSQNFARRNAKARTLLERKLIPNINSIYSGKNEEEWTF